MHGLCVHLCLFVLRVVVIHAGPWNGLESLRQTLLGFFG
jgi:hypothetical protein